MVAHLYVFALVSVWRLRVDRLSSFPIKLGLLIEEAVVSHTIRWRLVNVLQLVLVLIISTLLVEKLFVLRVISTVIFAVCNVCSVVPGHDAS